jgi:hypothetical protein
VTVSLEEGEIECLFHLPNQSIVALWEAPDLICLDTSHIENQFVDQGADSTGRQPDMKNREL